MIRKQTSLLLPLLLIVVLSFGSNVRAQHWDTTFSYQGFDWGVSALAWKGDTLVAAGSFTTAGGSKAYGIAFRIGEKWIPLPKGVDQYGYIYTIKIIGDDIYIGGQFGSVDDQPAGSIARYNLRDEQWSTMRGGVSKSEFGLSVNDLEFDGHYLYVGGAFDTAGTLIAHDLARWDTRKEEWSRVNDVIGEDAEVFDLLLRDDTLYVGGIFREVSGVPTNGLVAINLNDGTIASLSDDLLSYYSDGEVRIYALAWMKGELYAGGRIDSIANVVHVSNVLRRRGEKWEPVGEGVWPGVYRLEVYKDHLLTYGHSEGGIEGTDSYYFAYWDGATWHYPSNHYLPGYYLVRGDELTAAGAFWIDGDYGHAVARFDPKDSTWTPLDDTRTGGPLSSPYSMVAIGDNVFISGHYRQDYPGDEGFNNFDFFETIEQWDGMQWKTLFHSSGYDEHSLATDSRSLYTLGFEGVVRDQQYYYSLRSYDPSVDQWQDLAQIRVLGSSAPAMVYKDSALYIGAGILLDNDILFPTVACFDLRTKQFQALGDLTLNEYGYVSTIHLWQDQLVIGGRFDALGLKNLAAYDLLTRTWHPIGSCDSMSGTVISLETYKGDLVVGGYFTDVCDQPAGFIASWNGSEWNTLGGGFGENWYMTSIEDLHANGNDLYASGYFYTAGGDTVNHIARWDGAKWHAIDEASKDHDKGTNERVNRVVTVGNDVFIGGYFSTAGDIASDKFAAWRSDKSSVSHKPSRITTSLSLTNPVHENLTLSLPYEADWSVEIYDVLGIRVMESLEIRGARTTLSMPASLPKGLYVLRATNGSYVCSARFIKQ